MADQVLGRLPPAGDIDGDEASDSCMFAHSWHSDDRLVMSQLCSEV